MRHVQHSMLERHCMYGLPCDIDLEFFVDRTLLQVCVGENEVQLHFDSGVSLMISCNVRTTRGADSLMLDDIPELGRALTKWLGARVVSAAGDARGTLRLGWSDASTVEIFDTWDSYESYVVTHGARTIVV